MEIACYTRIDQSSCKLAQIWLWNAGLVWILHDDWSIRLRENRPEQSSQPIKHLTAILGLGRAKNLDFFIANEEGILYFCQGLAHCWSPNKGHILTFLGQFFITSKQQCVWGGMISTVPRFLVTNENSGNRRLMESTILSTIA